jgi:hypothetical protein
MPDFLDCHMKFFAVLRVSQLYSHLSPSLDCLADGGFSYSPMSGTFCKTVAFEGYCPVGLFSI